MVKHKVLLATIRSFALLVCLTSIEKTRQIGTSRSVEIPEMGMANRYLSSYYGLALRAEVLGWESSKYKVLNTPIVSSC